MVCPAATEHSVETFKIFLEKGDAAIKPGEFLVSISEGSDQADDLFASSDEIRQRGQQTNG